jgi:hypothetical protein
MKSGYTREKILIWAKTYPELSSKYLETVCTAGMLPSGKPLRLYPIPYRYLAGGKEQFSLYQWIPKSGVKLAIFMRICPKNWHLPGRFMQQLIKFHESKLQPSNGFNL